MLSEGLMLDLRFQVLFLMHNDGISTLRVLVCS